MYNKNYHQKYYQENKNKILKYQKQQNFKNQEKNKKYRKKYYLENKEKLKIQHKKYYLENHKKFLSLGKKYKLQNIEKIKKFQKKYSQTKEGKIARRRARKKNKAKRNRKFGWILMFKNPFNESVIIDYHHITDTYVVALPKDLHRLYTGYKYHRKMTMDIIKQIYLKE